MKNYLIKLLISTLLIVVISHFLKIEITDYTAAFFMAVALSLLNTFLKPILVFFTIPVTIMSLGLFLLVINAVIVKIADYFIDGISNDEYGQMAKAELLSANVSLDYAQYSNKPTCTAKVTLSKSGSASYEFVIWHVI